MKKFMLEEKTYTTDGKKVAKSEDILFACDFEKDHTSETLNIFDTIEDGITFMNNLPEPSLKCVNGEVCLGAYELTEVDFKNEFTFVPANGTLDEQLYDAEYQSGDIVQCRFAKHAKEIFSMSYHTNIELCNVLNDDMFIHVNDGGTFWDASHGLTDLVQVYFLANNKKLQKFDLSDADYGEWDISEINTFEKIVNAFKNEIGGYDFDKFTKFLGQIKIQ